MVSSGRITGPEHLSFITRAKRVQRLPEQIEIPLDRQMVSVRLRPNNRARRYTLNLGVGGSDPVLTIPAGGSYDGARYFLERNLGWLETRLSNRPSARPFRPGRVVPVRGVNHRIAHRPNDRGTVRVQKDGRSPVLAIAGDREHLERRLTDWLRRQARTDLEKAVFHYAAAVRARPTAIRLRDPKGRWGSCSSRGTLSFSWRLIMAPPVVLDYLAAHEVVHLREMNHSAPFWRLVHRICPNTDEAEAWLKAHGAGLHAFGAVGVG
ncbi:MAG: M48 family metallopeptidase [Alphaproteobacteria bacterium]